MHMTKTTWIRCSNQN